jgi:hypothetical protein
MHSFPFSTVDYAMPAWKQLLMTYRYIACAVFRDLFRRPSPNLQSDSLQFGLVMFLLVHHSASRILLATTLATSPTIPKAAKSATVVGK